jgi:protein SCO1/2
MLKIIRYAVFVLLAAIGGLWAHAWLTHAPGQSVADAFGQRLAQVFGQDMAVPSPAGVVQLPPGISLGGAFSLSRQDGVAVTERDYAGQWLLIYFGFTYCPDVCPTELGRMADVLDLLGPLAGRVTPVFITIDPERDRPSNLADYVSRFHPRLQGLTGTTEQIAAVARQFRVFYARANSPNSTEYLMDHSSFIYLVGPDNRVRSLFRPDTAVEGMASMIIGQLRAVSPPQ